MNIEWILLLLDYFRTLKIRNYLFEWSLPQIFAEAIFIVNIQNENITKAMQVMSSNAISLLGVLIGFSIAVITLLTATQSSNIEEIKKRLTRYSIGNKQLSLFDLLLINYTYSIIIEIFLAIVNIIILNTPVEMFSSLTCNIVNSINIMFITHILLLTVRNITNFYFVMFKK